MSNQNIRSRYAASSLQRITYTSTRKVIQVAGKIQLHAVGVIYLQHKKKSTLLNQCYAFLH